MTTHRYTKAAIRAPTPNAAPDPTFPLRSPAEPTLVGKSAEELIVDRLSMVVVTEVGASVGRPRSVVGSSAVVIVMLPVEPTRFVRTRSTFVLIRMLVKIGRPPAGRILVDCDKRVARTGMVVGTGIAVIIRSVRVMVTGCTMVVAGAVIVTVLGSGLPGTVTVKTLGSCVTTTVDGVGPCTTDVVIMGT